MNRMAGLTWNDPMHRGVGSTSGWLIAIGVALTVLGALAFFNLPAATAASVFVIGVLMLAGAGAQLVAALLMRDDKGPRFLSALMYGLAGALAIANPQLAATILTLVLGIALILSGATRVWGSVSLRSHPGWLWITSSGIISVLVGIVFVAGWPTNALSILGIILAFDLIFQGVTALGLGLSLTRTPEHA